MFDSCRVNIDIASYWQRRKNTRGRKKTFADETKPQAYTVHVNIRFETIRNIHVEETVHLES